MFCDIAGYTAMMQRDEREGLVKSSRYREVLRQQVAQHQGKIVQHFGDGSLSVFPSAVQSVSCALSIQQALQEEPRVPLRIGIHLGDIVLQGDDIYGNGVNIASRIEAIGAPGAVLFSESIYSHIRNHPDLPARRLGDFQFKNVEGPVQVYALTNEELHVPKPKGARSWLALPRTADEGLVLLRKMGAPLLLMLLLAAVGIWQLTSEHQPRLSFSEVVTAGVENFRGEEGDRVAVLPFENRTGDTSLTTVGVLAADWITQRLLETEQAKIVSSSTVQQNMEYVGILPGDAQGRPSFSEATGANKVIEGAYYLQGDSLYFSTQISDARTGDVLHDLPRQNGLKINPMAVVDVLSERIAGYWMTRDEVDKGKIKPPKMEAYRHWVEGRNAYGRDHRKSMQAFDEAIRLDSNFIMPYIGKLALTFDDDERREALLQQIKSKEAAMTRYEKQFLKFVESDDPEEAFQQVMKLHEMDPKSLLEKNIAADIALRTNRPQVAIRIIEDAANPHFNPENNFERQPTVLKARALYQTGQYKEAVRLIENVPFHHRDGSFHRIMVKSLVHTGSPEAVVAYIATIRRQAPGEWQRGGNGSYFHQLAASEYVLLDRQEEARHFAGLAEDHLNEGARAYTYLLTDRHREAERLYEELMRRDPVNPVYMARIGALKAELGDADEALQCVSKIMTEAEASASEAHYLSATVFAQMGDFEQAIEHLQLAYAAGHRFSDTNYGNDPLLDTMKRYQPFLDFIRPRE